MTKKPLTVAWISDFPVEWLPDPPPEVRDWPRRHPATWMISLLGELARDPGLRIHVVLLRKQLQRAISFEHGGATFHVLPARPWTRLGSLFWVDTLLIRRLLRNLQPDLVHAWGTEKGSGLIAHRLGYPYLMTIQGLFCWYKELVPLSRYDRFLERVERVTLRRAPVVTVESNSSVRYLRERHPRLRLFQAEHVPNRVFLGVRRAPVCQPAQFVTVGTMGYRKGTDLVFQAMEALGSRLDFRLTVITNPAPGMIEQLRPTVSPAVWERIQFKHHLTPEAVARALETPTMMLLPTRADNSPNAAKEAVVAGVPIIASDIGGIPDYVTQRRNGILFPPGSLAAFTSAIEEAVADPVLGRGLVDGGALAAARMYLSPELMAANFLRAYAAALSPG